MPIITPIIIPSGSSNGLEYVYPKWAEAIVSIGGIAVVVGIVWALVALALSIITDDDRIDLMEKPHIYSCALTLLGLAVLVIGIVLALLTRQQITQ